MDTNISLLIVNGVCSLAVPNPDVVEDDNSNKIKGEKEYVKKQWNNRKF